MRTDHPSGAPSLEQRAAMYAALGDATRLLIIDDLRCCDRSPSELSHRHRIPTNLLAHHLDVLEGAGLISRSVSSGDGRRRYIGLRSQALEALHQPVVTLPHRVLFLCSHNSARSQLAAALWTARTGRPAASAGTRPAPAVHRGAVAAARRAGLDLSTAQPRSIGRIPAGTQVVTVCDHAHEELEPASAWWHWSTPDPVPVGTAAAFDTVVASLDARISAVVASPTLTRSTSSTRSTS
jgi:protein-tyrosine-phosphatase/DNA-binding HxlR family transcriptional regulator